MPDFDIRADSVNVEQIMQQIRARIREKRGVDYTEQQIQELATVKLERFLDADKVRSELLDQFRQGTPPATYEFEDTTLVESHRPILRRIRRMLRPVLKLFFNSDKITHALHIQVGLNNRFEQGASLTFEVLHNLVVEVTRLGIEVKNLKMRVESLSSRLDFDERRARALEGVVQYKAGASVGASAPVAGAAPAPAEGAREGEGPAPLSRSRRRRRRRGRRGSAQDGRLGEQDETGATGQDEAVAAEIHTDGPAVDEPADSGVSGDRGSGADRQ
jgi:hypothetical protein